MGAKERETRKYLAMLTNSILAMEQVEGTMPVSFPRSDIEFCQQRTATMDAADARKAKKRKGKS